MRTIETLLAGKKLITTNQSILDSDLYHKSRVLIIDRNDPIIDPDFLTSPFKAVPDSIRQNYSCTGWLCELLKLQDDAKNLKNKQSIK
jgi:hypothetical protein